MPATAAVAPATPAEQRAEPAVVDAEGGGDRPVLREGAQRPASEGAPQAEVGAADDHDGRAEGEQRRDREDEPAQRDRPGRVRVDRRVIRWKSALQTLLPPGSTMMSSPKLTHQRVELGEPSRSKAHCSSASEHEQHRDRDDQR